jgi:alpha-methylacyl-CoA racemase
MAAIGPGPMAAMMLSDMGATVLRIERVTETDLGIKRPLKFNLLLRGRKAIALDLKNPRAIATVLDLISKADGLIEGFRPGVMERLGLGPDQCLQRNPRLVYGRMTGWGQQGPLSQYAAHDLNYIALTGALHATGRNGQPPSFALNLLGDFGGGATYLAFGMVCAMLEAQRSGQGQVVDAAIVDGTAHLMTSAQGTHAAGLMALRRGENIADSGSFFYDVYQCADGEWISIAPIEPKFYAQLLALLGIDPNEMPPQSDNSRWNEGKAILTRKFATRTRDEWCEVLAKTDACFAPVLTLAEAPHHPHMKARQTYLDIDGVVQPAPAPRFSRTQPGVPSAPTSAKQTRLEDALDGWMNAEEIERLRSAALTG